MQDNRGYEQNHNMVSLRATLIYTKVNLVGNQEKIKNFMEALVNQTIDYGKPHAYQSNSDKHYLFNFYFGPADGDKIADEEFEKTTKSVFNLSDEFYKKDNVIIYFEPDSKTYQYLEEERIRQKEAKTPKSWIALDYNTDNLKPEDLIDSIPKMIENYPKTLQMKADKYYKLSFFFFGMKSDNYLPIDVIRVICTCLYIDIHTAVNFMLLEKMLQVFPNKLQALPQPQAKSKPQNGVSNNGQKNSKKNDEQVDDDACRCIIS